MIHGLRSIHQERLTVSGSNFRADPAKLSRSLSSDDTTERKKPEIQEIYPDAKSREDAEHDTDWQ